MRHLSLNLCSFRKKTPTNQSLEWYIPNCKWPFVPGKWVEIFHLCFMYVCTLWTSFSYITKFTLIKNIFFSKVLLQSFGSFFWYFQGWDDGKTDTIKWWFTAYEQVKGTGLWNRQPIYQTQRRGWIPVSCAPWMPRAPKGNTTNLVNLTRLTWVPPRLEVFLIHSSQGDEPSLWLHAKLSAGNFPW